MIDWPQVWGYLIAGALSVFSALAVIVAIGGYFDILNLFERLRNEHDDPPAD